MNKEQLIALIDIKLRQVALIHSGNSTPLARDQVIKDAIASIKYELDNLVEDNSSAKVKEVKTGK